jgi:hypothetical protein
MIRSEIVSAAALGPTDVGVCFVGGGTRGSACLRVTATGAESVTPSCVLKVDDALTPSRRRTATADRPKKRRRAQHPGGPMSQPASGPGHVTAAPCPRRLPTACLGVVSCVLSRPPAPAPLTVGLDC